MKQLALILVLCTAMACAPKLNTEIISQDRPAYLVGEIDKSGLQSNSYATWFNENYDTYTPDTETINEIKDNLKDYDITVFMGTWCGDSKREVPHFYKILELSDYPMKQLTTIAVNRAKETPEQHEADLNIVRVPTLIFYKDGKEVNRIIEYPVESLEKDMQKIVTNTAYEPNYFGVKREK